MKADLSQLRDIHLPAPVSWWPPAPGWWLLTLGVLLLVGVTYVVYRRRRAERWRRVALSEWRHLREDWQAGSIDDPAVLRELSALLRRVAVVRFPRERTAGLTGEQWVGFLNAASPGTVLFDETLAPALIAGPYAAHLEIEVETLFEACRRWLHQLPRRHNR